MPSDIWCRRIGPKRTRFSGQGADLSVEAAGRVSNFVRLGSAELGGEGQGALIGLVPGGVTA